MSIKVPDTFAPEHSSQNRELVYPAEFHFRIIVDAGADAEAALSAAIAGYKVTAPLAASRSSSAGRYRAYCASVEIQSQSELHAFDAAVKRVPGVRMLL